MKYLASWLLCFQAVAGALQLAPETAAARDAILKQYRRIDAAQNSGRLEDILALGLPDARAGSFVSKVSFKDFVNNAKRAMSSIPGIQASIATSITDVKLSGDEATVRTRSDGTITTNGQRQTMRQTSQDVWVRQAKGEWLLKDVTLLTHREVQPPVPPETVKAVAKAIASHAVPLSSVEAGAPSEDLTAFGKAVGDARIVLLGEATHGSREIFQMKHRLLEYLVKEKGFTVFAKEANWPESQALDRYIKTGDGDPRQGLQDMYFWTWRTQEVLAMVEWMRRFNQAPGNHPILSFTSFDMQYYKFAAQRVLAFVQKHAQETEVPAAVESAYRGLSDLPRNVSQDPSFQSASAAAEKVTALLESAQEQLVKAAGAAAFRDALQMTRIVTQALRMRVPGAATSFRDEMMAKNVAWLANELYPGEKIVVWAHNGHVNGARNIGYEPMGSWLRKAFGRQMYVTGFAIDTGTVRAIGAGAQSTGLSSYVIPPAPAGSGTAVLSAAGKPLFFLDLATARKAGGPFAEWLSSRHAFRECGAVWNLEDAEEGNMVPVTLAEAYDGLIFLEKTEAAKGL